MRRLATVTVIAAFGGGALLAGVPGRWAPLIVGGGIALLTALVTGGSRREDEAPMAPPGRTAPRTRGGPRA